MINNSIDPVSHTIFEAIACLGSPKDPKLIADQVLRLWKGLSAEDELSLMLCWLGKCRLIHKLDQLQTPPLSKSIYQVPDLLVVFEHAGRSIPVLIEVKTSAKPALKWRLDYMEKLRNYSAILNLPLLVACKWEGGPFLWTLNDVVSFKKQSKSYKLERGEAIYSNLMFTLAGNFALIFKEGTTFHMKGHKISEPKPGNTPNTFRVECKLDGESYYTDSKGNKIEELPQELSSFFSGGEDGFTYEGDVMHFKFITLENTFRSADKVFASLLSKKKSIQWREVLIKFGIPKSALEILEQARASKIIDKVLIIEPKIVPKFMSRLMV